MNSKTLNLDLELLSIGSSGFSLPSIQGITFFLGLSDNSPSCVMSHELGFSLVLSFFLPHGTDIPDYFLPPFGVYLLQVFLLLKLVTNIQGPEGIFLTAPYLSACSIMTSPVPSVVDLVFGSGNLSGHVYAR